MEGRGVDSEGLTERVDAASAGRDGRANEAGAVDPFADPDAPIRSEAERKGMTRDEAITHGREMARLECEQLSRRRPDVYTPDVVRGRIARAGDYAAWDYDGRQAGTIGRRK